AELIEDLETVHSRHLDVEQDQIRAVLVYLAKRLMAVPGRLYLISRPLQGQLHQPDLNPRIFDDQHQRPVFHDVPGSVPYSKTWYFYRVILVHRRRRSSVRPVPSIAQLSRRSATSRERGE